MNMADERIILLKHVDHFLHQCADAEISDGNRRYNRNADHCTEAVIIE